jgi:hypothetical protein
MNVVDGVMAFTRSSSSSFQFHIVWLMLSAPMTALIVWEDVFVL